MSDCCAIEASNRQERILLWTMLALSAVMFFVEFTAGWLGRSSGLMADVQGTCSLKQASEVKVDICCYDKLHSIIESG